MPTIIILWFRNYRNVGGCEAIRIFALYWKFIDLFYSLVHTFTVNHRRMSIDNITTREKNNNNFFFGRVLLNDFKLITSWCLFFLVDEFSKLYLYTHTVVKIASECHQFVGILLCLYSILIRTSSCTITSKINFYFCSLLFLFLHGILFSHFSHIESGCLKALIAAVTHSASQWEEKNDIWKVSLASIVILCIAKLWN